MTTFKLTFFLGGGGRKGKYNYRGIAVPRLSLQKGRKGGGEGERGEACPPYASKHRSFRTRSVSKLQPLEQRGFKA